uniref:Uncharacterized protein n=1 Tax=Salvator merianae TaxID=96440 RepID=A0A8D0AXM4_SALMN
MSSRGEILPKLAPQDNNENPHLEVLRVHMQLVAVQLAQLGESVLDVVQVLDGISEGGEHLLAVRLHPGVAGDGGGAGEEAAAAWGLPSQGFGADDGHVNLGPYAGDELLLLCGPVHHGGSRPGASLSGLGQVAKLRRPGSPWHNFYTLCKAPPPKRADPASSGPM